MTSEYVELDKIYLGDCLETMKQWPDGFVNCIVSSPPYWGLRDYGVSGQIGLEATPDEYVFKMVKVFREAHRVLSDDGTLWLNLGDSFYNYRPGKGQGLTKQTLAKENQDLPSICARRGNKQESLKEKDLVGIPWMVAFALRTDGWYLRSDIIWHKPNPMPESVTDRPTKAHEYLFLLTKSQKYYYDAEAITEDAISFESKGRSGFGSKNGKNDTEYKAHSNDVGHAWEKSEKRNKRSVWTIPTAVFNEAHFATFPEDLINPCIMAGSKLKGIVFDPFMGAGTTALAALKLNRKFLGCELNPAYIKIAEKRIDSELRQVKFI